MSTLVLATLMHVCMTVKTSVGVWYIQFTTINASKCIVYSSIFHLGTWSSFWWDICSSWWNKWMYTRVSWIFDDWSRSIVEHPGGLQGILLHPLSVMSFSSFQSHSILPFYPSSGLTSSIMSGHQGTNSLNKLTLYWAWSRKWPKSTFPSGGSR